MGKLERLANLRHQSQRLRRCEAARAHHLAQIHTIHKFHQEVEEAPCLAVVVNADDARMIEPCQHARLTVETLGECAVTCQWPAEELQRDQAIQLGLAGLEHRAHASSTDQLEDLELRKCRRHSFQWGRRRMFPGRLACLRRCGDGHQGAFWANALQGLGRNRAAALRTTS